MQADIGMPHIAFETKADAYTDAEGHTLYRDIIYARVTPRGGKDSLYQNAEDWLANLKAMSVNRAGFDQDAPMYAQWFDRASEMLNLFKAGNEMPLYGTALRATLAFSPAEVAICRQVKIFTLEELAGANEQAMSHMGMGARAMRGKAQEILKNSVNNKAAEENAALKLQLDELRQTVEDLKKKQPQQKAA